MIEHRGLILVQSKYYVPIDGGFSYVILDERMRVVKQGATKNHLTRYEAEWLIDNLRMENKI